MIIRHLGKAAYETIWQQMQAFTYARDSNTPDELWLLEHPPVFTQGQAGKPEHLLRKNEEIPLIQSDRGGQITYHGPGQLVAYVLIDLKRHHIGIRQLVSFLEQTIIDVLYDYKITAYRECKRPGVYVNNAKICSIGLRVRQGCSYHGLAFNIDMDLTPFSYINPCGYSSLVLTQLKDLIAQPVNKKEVETKLIHYFLKNFETIVQIPSPIGTT